MCAVLLYFAPPKPNTNTKQHEPMLSALLLAVAAVVSTTATNDMLQGKTLLRKTKDMSSFVEVEAAVTLPMASHAVLMNAVRDHPHWFVHMNFDGEHIVGKLPRRAKVGEKAFSLLQMYMTAELETQVEDGKNYYKH